MFLITVVLASVLLASCGATDSFGIACIDSVTGLGVPLVMVRTGNYLQYYTDSAGIIAFNEPGMMSQPVFFSVLADGYKIVGGQQYPQPYDSGIVLTTTLGTVARVLLNRTQHAQRMYRLTGAGLYRDSVIMGLAVPRTAEPRAVVDPATGVFGQDTVMVATYKNQIFWVWGDSVCPRSARQNNCESTGMYSVGAVSCVPSERNATCLPTDPPGLQYLAQESPVGFHHPLPLAPIAPLEQNTWLSGMTVLDAGTPQEALYAFFFKNPGDGAGPGTAQQGMARWSDARRTFEPVVHWPMNTTLVMDHTVQVLSPQDAVKGYVYYAHNGVVTRAPATTAAMASYDAFEALPASAAVPELWGSGSVNWNAWAGRYLYLGAGDNSSMYVGFSHTLMGPWENGTQVASHFESGSSCYNPVHLPHMDAMQGRVISFACTYTAMWSNTMAPSLWTSCLFGINSKLNCAPVVPRYEYNNLIYRVDLAELPNFKTSK